MKQKLNKTNLCSNKIEKVNSDNLLSIRRKLHFSCSSLNLNHVTIFLCNTKHFCDLDRSMAIGDILLNANNGNKLFCCYSAEINYINYVSLLTALINQT